MRDVRPEASDAASRAVTAQPARGALPAMACISSNARSPPRLPIVQKKATSGRRPLLAAKYDLTGDETDQAQTGVPMTTKS